MLAYKPPTIPLFYSGVPSAGHNFKANIQIYNLHPEFMAFLLYCFLTKQDVDQTKICEYLRNKMGKSISVPDCYKWSFHTLLIVL